MAIPIWKDKIVTLSGTGAFNIRLNSASGAVIFSGKAESIGSTRKVRINDICADYIANNLPRFGETYGNGYTTTFCVEQGGSSVETVTFYWNWSYDYDFVEADEGDVPGDININRPIRTSLPRGIIIPFSYLRQTSDYIEIMEWAHGEGFEDFYIPSTPNGFDTAIGVKKCLLTAPVSVIAYEVLQDAAEMVEDMQLSYYLTDSCAKYAIYYINAYGGWDVLAIEGNTCISSAFSRIAINREYNNTFESAEGKITAVNEETRKFTFNTGWVDDIGASRMHHLLGTTKAYLCEVASRKMIPITITDTAAEVRTHRADGMLNYKINAEIAQSFVRR